MNERADRYDSPRETAGYDGHNSYQETAAEVRARIASQDELPTPEESRAATWGDNPHFPDEADPDEDEGDPSPPATEAGTPAQPDADAQPVDKQPAQSDNAKVTEDPDTPDSSAAEQPKALAAERYVTRHEFDQVMQKLADLEAKNANPEAKNAGPVAKSDEQTARIDEQVVGNDERDDRIHHIEQLPAGADGQPDEAGATEHAADKPGNSLSQDTLRAARKDTHQGSDVEVAEQAEVSRWKRAISPERLDAFQTLGGAGWAIESLATNATPDTVVGLVLAGVGILKILMTKYGKKGKA